MNQKFVKVMDGLKSNAGGFEYKINKVNIASKWDKSSLDPEIMGGFNFGTEDKILRWLHRGDTIYDVIVPGDAEIVEVDREKGIFRSNKIIVTNPRKITDKIILDLAQKTTLNNKYLAQSLQVLLWKNHLDVAKKIIIKKVCKENVDEILDEFIKYASNGDEDYDFSSGLTGEIHRILSEIKSDLLMSLVVDKKPYIKELTSDKVINLTGQSGSGKSTYAANNFNSEEYLIIDTDEIFSNKRFDLSKGINKELGNYFRNKYKNIPILTNDFDLIYNEILNYCKNSNKTIVIDCAQFHCIKDINNLKGKIIIIRTSINTCYNRCIERYKKTAISYTEEELEFYKKKKLGIFEWYKYSNEFIKKVDKIHKKT